MGIHNIMGTQFITLRRNIVGTRDIMGPIPARKNAHKRLKESSVLPLFWLPKKFDASVFYAAS